MKMEMNELLIYTLKSALVLALLYLPYTLMLRRERFFRLNRATLLSILVLAVVLQQGILSLLLNTFWLKVLYGLPYLPTLVGRLVQAGIMAALQIVLIPLLAKAINDVEKRAKL